MVQDQLLEDTMEVLVVQQAPAELGETVELGLAAEEADMAAEEAEVILEA